MDEAQAPGRSESPPGADSAVKSMEVIRTIATVVTSIASIVLAGVGLVLSIVTIAPSYSTSLICGRDTAYYVLRITQEGGQHRVPEIYVRYPKSIPRGELGPPDLIRWGDIDTDPDNSKVHRVKIPVLDEGYYMRGAVVEIVPYPGILGAIFNMNASSRVMDCYGITEEAMLNAYRDNPPELYEDECWYGQLVMRIAPGKDTDHRISDAVKVLLEECFDR